MNLTEDPEIVHWPETHYVFIENTGSFHKIAPETWQTAISLVPLLIEHSQIVGRMSLYKMNPNVYRAGFVLPQSPIKLPAEFTYDRFPGGKYRKFVLTGPYSEMSQASGRVWEIVSKSGIMVRADFAIENYVNDPTSTPTEKLITEILVPAA